MANKRRNSMAVARHPWRKLPLQIHWPVFRSGTGLFAKPRFFLRLLNAQPYGIGPAATLPRKRLFPATANRVTPRRIAPRRFGSLTAPNAEQVAGPTMLAHAGTRTLPQNQLRPL